MSRARRWFPVWLLSLALVLTGCVSVPTQGPVEAGDSGTRVPDIPVEIVPEPPEPGASPGVIVEGFLQAMANYQSGYTVAREYLAPAVRESWRPENGVQIYADSYPITDSENPTLRAPLLGEVAADGSYTHRNEPDFQVDFGMVKDDNGEWRISTPPDGLLLSQYYFQQFYRSLNLYFLEPGHSSVVPDPIYLPSGNQTATALLQALLRGPTKWLKPAVQSAIPAGTTLNVSSPIDSEGVADVSLSDDIASLNEEQRSLLAAQITWTLKQVDGITGIRLQVNGTPFPVIRDETSDGVIPIDAHRQYAPVDPQASGQLVGVAPDGVVRVDESGAQAGQSPLPGPLGATDISIDSLALSFQGDLLAAVTDGGTRLLTAPVAEVEPTVHLSEASDLLRPQFTRYQELWAIGRNAKGDQQAWVVKEGQISAPEGDVFGDGEIISFRISPDGTRVALVRRVGGHDELGLARINRSGKELSIEGWRPVAVNVPGTSDVRRFVDVGWTDATNLMLLGSSDDETEPEPYLLDQEGAVARLIGQSDEWEAESLAVSPRVQGTRAMVQGADGRTWRFEDENRWLEYGTDLSAIAYPG
ncbi:MAG: LpqB family beta-propeller domain-containing protein [Propionibacteriaceae bacterium]